MPTGRLAVPTTAVGVLLLAWFLLLGSHRLSHSTPKLAVAPRTKTARSIRIRRKPTPAKKAPPIHSATPRVVRGIYLTGWTAGNPSFLLRSVRYLKTYGLNTLVIDVKDDDGRLSFPLPGTEAEAMGAAEKKIAHPRAMLRYLHAQGIYVIGRLVTFCDPFLSAHAPAEAITQGGRLWLDNRGLSWTNPEDPAVWRYNIQIAKAAARLGFDEIQFDYVRFPASPWVAQSTTPAIREAAIENFLHQAVAALHRDGVPVSADVFGLTTVAHSDMGIGQLYGPIAPMVDYVSPMLYPSLYAPFTFGQARPNSHPFRTVYLSLLGAREKTAGEKGVRTRPWLQDYTLGPPAYGAPQVDKEFLALGSAGYSSFLLWNPANIYSDGIEPDLVNIAKAVYDNTYCKGAHHQ